MNPSLQGKLIAGFVLAFLAGAATGAFITFHESPHWHGGFGRHSHSVAERMRNRIQSQLDLTPQQMAEVAPILDRAVAQLQKIRAETGSKVREVMKETNQAVKPLLTDAQRQKLTQLDRTPEGKHRPRHPSRRRGPREAEPEPGTPDN